MSAPQSDSLETQVRECVRELHARGRCYIKVAHVSSELDLPSQRISPYVGDLVCEGDLEIWREGKTSGSHTYRITLDE